MGYGKNLEDAIKAKGWSVAETARKTGVNVNTLHGIIRRDSPVRYDHALRISNVLGIDIKEICKDNPYDDGEYYPPLDDEGNFMDKLNKSGYLKNRLGNLLSLYPLSEYPIIDEVLTNFYTLNDDNRRQAIDYLHFLNGNGSDPIRIEQVKKITKSK